MGGGFVSITGMQYIGPFIVILVPEDCKFSHESPRLLHFSIQWGGGGRRKILAEGSNVKTEKLILARLLY